MKLNFFFCVCVFICLVILCEFSTIIMLHSQFCRQFAHWSFKQFILLWFSRAPGNLYTFFWQRGPLCTAQRGGRYFFFLTLQIQNIILQRQMQTDIFETCQYLNLTSVRLPTVVCIVSISHDLVGKIISFRRFAERAGRTNVLVPTKQLLYCTWSHYIPIIKMKNLETFPTKTWFDYLILMAYIFILEQLDVWWLLDIFGKCTSVDVNRKATQPIV